MHMWYLVSKGRGGGGSGAGGHIGGRLIVYRVPGIAKVYSHTLLYMLVIEACTTVCANTHLGTRCANRRSLPGDAYLHILRSMLVFGVCHVQRVFWGNYCVALTPRSQP